MNLRSLAATFLFIFSIFNVAQSAEQLITTVVTDDLHAPIYKLIIDTNDGREIKNFYKDVYVKGTKIRRDILDQNQLRQVGLVLDQRDQHVLMNLKSTNFDIFQGGFITIDTLYSGVTGERKGYDVQIAQGKTQWNMFYKGKVIKQINIQTNRIFLIGAVGIKNLVIR